MSILCHKVSKKVYEPLERTSSFWDKTSEVITPKLIPGLPDSASAAGPSAAGPASTNGGTANGGGLMSSLDHVFKTESPSPAAAPEGPVSDDNCSRLVYRDTTTGGFVMVPTTISIVVDEKQKR